MTAFDALLCLSWLAAAATGVALVVALRRHGVAATYVRDVLHIGAGLWVLGWPLWRSPWPPTLLSLVAAAVVISAPRLQMARALVGAVCSADEHWHGIALYGAAYAAFTAVGLLGAGPFPAGAALLSLSLGDGLGGLIGRRYGRLRYRAPGAKRKSVEGSLTVAAASALALLVAGALFGAPLSVALVAGGALVAALAEALAPQASDNLIVPGAQWCWLRWAVG